MQNKSNSPFDYDYIIIGSGFGGSVSALRLSEKGYKVLVIEKGKWYQSTDFAKTNWNLRKWLWIPALRLFGIMKITFFRHIVILSGAGVGGGSLVYANTLPVPKRAFYKTGTWAKLDDWENKLKPYYERAYHMLGAAQNPKLYDGDLALQKLAEERGITDNFEATKVSVFFGKPGVEVDDPYFGGKGPKRVGCTFCGGCMTGCRHNAKNTLDKNYLFLAQQLGAEILAEQEVYGVKPLDGKEGEGYEVRFKSSTRFFKKKKRLTAGGVVFSGGVLGTVKLLLKLKQNGSLPFLSDKTGEEIRTNNETLISVSSLKKDIDVSKGIAIGSILHTDENTHLEICRYAEGSGFWKLLHFPMSQGVTVFRRLVNTFKQVIKHPVSYFKVFWVNSWSKRTVILLFMQTLDSTINFRRGLFGRMVSTVGNGKPPTPDIPESAQLTKEYAEIVDGMPTTFSLETLMGLPSTAHILGGAVMGATREEGVIDKNNRVFGYKNMFVIDGSMISANPGVNPSLSITAIAEHAMDQVPEKKGNKHTRKFV
ncbi:putative cholesterol oxidase [Fulvivirga imtechensis AK7]|uniref:Cholesterol oxidase n=1 Tax=Fulvivirga imtechensis AK7 TaxID=1237149 RepID=L8JW89_9BACT|nr:GMC family oxidoreductase [Fulvivirga imtechensis]ELR72468.1 putative cholesterol oxidase [Fulvivirga imtechensis AK7]